MRKFLFIIFSIILFSSISLAVTINTEKVGYVDLDVIFENYPDTLAAKTEVDDKKAKFALNLKNKEDEIQNLENDYNIFVSSINFYKSQKSSIEEENLYEIAKATTTDFVVNVSTETALKEAKTKVDENNKKKIELDQLIKNLEKNKTELENKIASKKDGLQKYKQDTEMEIMKLQEAYSYNILGEIYDTICEVSKKEGCSIIVDKNNILYGEELSDLTNVILEYLKKK